jgi:hypothetical protein
MCKDKASNESELKDNQAELADTWGMKGGVLRRKPDLAEALRAYESGRRLEALGTQSTTISVTS